MREKEDRQRETGWSARILFRYLLLQFPGWLLVILILLSIDLWIDLPTWVMFFGVFLWIAKDALMFPFVWRAYDPTPQGIAFRMIGERAFVKENLSPSGYVQVHGELWQAELLPDEPAVEKGRKVRIRDVRGLTLIVQPER
jgi:membrane protein implicated in regulation of membrane protease activity